MAIKQGDRIFFPHVKVESDGVEKREVQEIHLHRPPFPTEVVKGHKLPSCMVLNTGHSNRGKNVLHIYYDREQQQPEVTEELLLADLVLTCQMV